MDCYTQTYPIARKVHKCDFCGKEMGRWYRITISPLAMYDQMNVSHMIIYSGSKDVCEECMEKLKAKWGEMSSEQHSESEIYRA